MPISRRVRAIFRASPARKSRKSQHRSKHSHTDNKRVRRAITANENLSRFFSYQGYGWRIVRHKKQARS